VFNDINELDDLYQEIILDHYKSPRNHRLLEAPDLKAEGFNPFCGDQVIFTAKVDGDGRIGQVGLTSQGCAISQASASMMGQLLKGHTVEEAEALAGRFKAIMQGKETLQEEETELGELAALEGVKRFPIRIKCALLGWAALQDAILEYRQAMGGSRSR
jgi:nitrogen fixation NifU-like protein